MAISSDERGRKIIHLQCDSILDSPPDRILEGAMEKLDTVLVIGYDKDGEYYFASSSADGGICMWLLEQAKLSLLRAAEDE